MSKDKQIPYKLLDDYSVPDDMIEMDEHWAFEIVIDEETIICRVNWVKFDELNEDGTCTIDIDYDIIEGQEPDDFADLLGPMVMGMIEESLYIKDRKKALDEAIEEARAHKP